MRVTDMDENGRSGEIEVALRSTHFQRLFCRTSSGAGALLIGVACGTTEVVA
jgi:hypothetical protein